MRGGGTQLLVAMSLAVMLASGAMAHEQDHRHHAQHDASAARQLPFGRPGDPKKATRTIRVDMSDKMRFSPDVVTVSEGETVRFIAANKGAMLHEIVIGTSDELGRHAEMMRKHPGMEHDEAYMAHVRPGKSEALVWQFNRPGEFEFACLIAGHFEAGMTGRIIVNARRPEGAVGERKAR